MCPYGGYQCNTYVPSNEKRHMFPETGIRVPLTRRRRAELKKIKGNQRL
jgi:hypothetical protein